MGLCTVTIVFIALGGVGLFSLAILLIRKLMSRPHRQQQQQQQQEQKTPRSLESGTTTHEESLAESKVDTIVELVQPRSIPAEKPVTKVDPPSKPTKPTKPAAPTTTTKLTKMTTARAAPTPKKASTPSYSNRKKSSGYTSTSHSYDYGGYSGGGWFSGDSSSNGCGGGSSYSYGGGGGDSHGGGSYGGGGDSGGGCSGGGGGDGGGGGGGCS